MSENNLLKLKQLNILEIKKITIIKIKKKSQLIKYKLYWTSERENA